MFRYKGFSKSATQTVVRALQLAKAAVAAGVQVLLAQQGITLLADDEAVAELAKDGFDPQYGARPLRRAIQNQVEDAVAEQMLEGSLKSGDTAHVRLKDGKVVIEK